MPFSTSRCLQDFDDNTDGRLHFEPAAFSAAASRAKEKMLPSGQATPHRPMRDEYIDD